MGTQRTIITISDDEKSWLETYSKINKISMAEAIRRGILQLKNQDSRSVYKTLVNDTRGLWGKGDGLAYQKMIRSEWGS
jgi:hypothetical protein